MQTQKKTNIDFFRLKMINGININYYNTIILGGIPMKVIVHFEEKGPNIQDLIEELLLECCSSA